MTSMQQWLIVNITMAVMSPVTAAAALWPADHANKSTVKTKVKVFIVYTDWTHFNTATLYCKDVIDYIKHLQNG